jgi:hypothetical protein
MKHLTYIIIVAFIVLGCENQKNQSIQNNSVVDTGIDEPVNNLCKSHLTDVTSNIILPEFIVTDKDFAEYVLDTLIEQYNKCEYKEEGYHFVISIGDVTIENYSNAKNLYINRSFYKDFISDGYGFFYHKGYLFILRVQQINDVFRATNKTKAFLYKEEPVVTFDPPRWLYYYWNKEFYFIHGSPCGG